MSSTRHPIGSHDFKIWVFNLLDFQFSKSLDFRLSAHISAIYSRMTYKDQQPFSSGIHFSKLSLGLLQYKIDRGILDPAKITMFDLVSQQIVKMPEDYTGIKLDIQVN